MSDIVLELLSPGTGWSGDAACVSAEVAERGAEEIKRLRDKLDWLRRHSQIAESMLNRYDRSVYGQ